MAEKTYTFKKDGAEIKAESYTQALEKYNKSREKETKSTSKKDK